MPPGQAVLHVGFALLLGSLTLSSAQDARALIESGASKTRAGHYNSAIDDYTRAIVAEPGHHEAYVHRAAAKSFKEDWKGALEDLNAATALKARSPEIYGIRAFAHLHLGDFEAAKADFATAERLDPQNGLKIKLRFAQELITRARDKSISGDNAAAVKQLDMIIAIAPELGVAYHERGAAKGMLQQYKEAIADFDLAIKFDTWHNKQGDSHRLRAGAKRALGDIAGAEADEAEAARRSGSAPSQRPQRP